MILACKTICDAVSCVKRGLDDRPMPARQLLFATQHWTAVNCGDSKPFKNYVTLGETSRARGGG